MLETLEAAEELRYKLAIVSVTGWQFRPPCLRANHRHLQFRQPGQVVQEVMEAIADLFAATTL